MTHPSLGRRTLLQAAVAAPAAATLLGGPAAAQAATSQAATGGRFDRDSPRFTIGVLPDTQYLFDEDSSDPAPFRQTFRFLTEARRGAEVVGRRVPRGPARARQ